jgi:hypothetical protein
MAQNSLPLTQFTDAEGNDLSDGFLLINISTDVQTPTGQLGANQKVRVQLDGSGSVSGTPLFWPNASLLPLGTVYLLRAYTNAGQLVTVTPIVVTVTPASPTGFGSAFGASFSS